MEKTLITAENYESTFVSPSEAQTEDPDSCKYPSQVSNFRGYQVNKVSKSEWSMISKIQAQEWGNGR